MLSSGDPSRLRMPSVSAAASRRRMSALRQHVFGPTPWSCPMPDTAAPPSPSTVEIKIKTPGNGSPDAPSSPHSQRPRTAMHKKINKVAVLGAGTMGARIAAHLANAGVPCLLLDIVPKEASAGTDRAQRNATAAAGLEAAKKSKPPAFFEPSLARLVTVGNFED